MHMNYELWIMNYELCMAYIHVTHNRRIRHSEYIWIMNASFWIHYSENISILVECLILNTYKLWWPHSEYIWIMDASFWILISYDGLILSTYELWMPRSEYFWIVNASFWIHMNYGCLILNAYELWMRPSEFIWNEAMQKTCHTYEGCMAYVHNTFNCRIYHVQHLWIMDASFWIHMNALFWIHMNEACHESRLWRKHVTHMNDAWHTHMSHIIAEYVMINTFKPWMPYSEYLWMRRVTNREYGWNMSHLWMRHVTHVDAPCMYVCMCIRTERKWKHCFHLHSVYAI